MSPVSPVFHTVVTVRIGLKLGTRRVEGRIPDQGTGPFPTNNGEHNLGTLEAEIVETTLRSRFRF